MSDFNPDEVLSNPQHEDLRKEMENWEIVERFHDEETGITRIKLVQKEQPE